MNDILYELFMQYNNISNNKVNIDDKTKLVLSKFSISNDLPLFGVGVLYDFISNEPQYYYDKNVKNEVLDNLNILYDIDKDKFLKSFYTHFDKFFYSLNSYYSILELYDEFNDIGLEDITKVKIYDIPLMTQLMEYCLNHFYRGIASIEGNMKNKDYTSQKTLGKLKNVLSKNYPNLLKIDIDFRDAVSHGMLEANDKGINYLFTEKTSRETIFNQLSYYDLEKKKNDLIDIASGALVGLFIFIIQKELITVEYLNSMDEKTTFEFFKLFLHNENIRIKSYSKDMEGLNQFFIYINIKNINTQEELIHLFVLIAKIMFIYFSNYERYFINYNHPYSISGMVGFSKNQLEKMLFENDIAKLDNIIGNGDSVLLIPDIQDVFQDNRSYKFHTFPKISGNDWEIIDITDISNEDSKRFKVKLIIDKENISKREVEVLLLQVGKKIRMFENKSNPISKIKSGKIEADLVRIEVFYRRYERGSFSLMQDNEKFICLAHYYKNWFVPKITVPFQNNYDYKKIKKFDIFWSKGFKG